MLHELDIYIYNIYIYDVNLLAASCMSVSPRLANIYTYINEYIAFSYVYSFIGPPVYQCGEHWSGDPVL